MNLKYILCEKFLRGHFVRQDELERFQNSGEVEIKTLCRICNCLCVLERQRFYNEHIILSRENGKKVDEVLV